MEGVCEWDVHQWRRLSGQVPPCSSGLNSLPPNHPSSHVSARRCLWNTVYIFLFPWSECFTSRSQSEMLFSPLTRPSVLPHLSVLPPISVPSPPSHRFPPISSLCPGAGWAVLGWGLARAPRRVSGYCARALLERLWIHLDFISELFWFPAVDNPWPSPWGRENDGISSLKSSSCS